MSQILMVLRGNLGNLYSLSSMAQQVSPLSGGLGVWELESKQVSRARYSCHSTNRTSEIPSSSTDGFVNLVKSPLPLAERFQRCHSVGAECVNAEELRDLLSRKDHPICYDGFEPSGRMHLAQGILKAQLVNKLTSSGCVFVFWVADWFALLNNKLGGDMHRIRTTGEYFIEVWKSVGMDMRNVRFLWASEEINKRPNEYWTLVMDIARKNTISRVKRCCTIMGREEADNQPVAHVMYPCMQCADIFFLNADICQLGMDQRKVNMLAREYCDDIGRKEKPVILSHFMLPGMNDWTRNLQRSWFRIKGGPREDVQIRSRFCYLDGRLRKRCGTENQESFLSACRCRGKPMHRLRRKAHFQSSITDGGGKK
eukprot:GHVN01034902.1.p1 GENE.GHVN01034902.1~~GHVN01034902.1.p1  ORF type:complete len:369 (+),score=21.02 GHVN01034902.1:395-1501(+)